VTSETSKSVRTGVVGLGYWGPNLARNIADNTRSELTWLCDPRADALLAAGRRHLGANTTTSVETMLADPELDAVAIVTPISTHYDLALAALEAGKHVLIEKPLAASSAQALDLIRRAEEAGLVLLPGHTFLYSPVVVKIKELLDAGVLGEIYFVSMSRVNLGLHQHDASVVWDLAPHDFSILNYWLDQLPGEVSAMTRSCVLPDTSDVAFVNMQYDSGAIAHLELSWLSPVKLRRTVVVGSQKMLVYDDVSNEPIRIFDSGAELPTPESFGEFRLAYRTGDIVSPKVEATEPLALEVADFCAAILDGVAPRSSAQIGLNVVRMIEAVERSLATRGMPTRVSTDPVEPEEHSSPAAEPARGTAQQPPRRLRWPSRHRRDHLRSPSRREASVSVSR
jgi:predicted dehydrogenase